MQRMISLDQTPASPDQMHQLKELVDAPADVPGEDLERDEQRELVRRGVWRNFPNRSGRCCCWCISRV